MIMEQAVMPMDTTKYNHRHQSFYQTYQPPYFWTRYLFPLLLQNISLHTSGQDINSLYFCKISASILLEQDMTYSSEVRDKGDPFSKLFGVNFTRKVYFHSNVYNKLQNVLLPIVPSKWIRPPLRTNSMYHPISCTHS